jgi:hypothetical protein
LNVGGVHAKHPKFAAAISECNSLKCVTIGVYIHVLEHVVEFQDIYGEQLDLENFAYPTWDVAVIAWKTSFCKKFQCSGVLNSAIREMCGLAMPARRVTK